MTEAYVPSVGDLLAEQRTRSRALMTYLVVTVVLVFGAMGALTYLAPVTPNYSVGLVGFSVFICLAIPVAVWNNPRIGLYLMVVGSLLLGGGSYMVRDTIPTTYVPFWWNISTISMFYARKDALKALVFSPAEVLMVITFLAWLIRGIVARELRFEKGAFLGWILAYIAMVTFGFIFGITKGGDTTMALYEVRSQAHFLLGYIMATNLIRERKHAVPLVWLLVLSAGLLAVFGTRAYFVLGSKITEQGIMGHDDSLVLNLLLFAFFIAAITRVNRRLTIWTAVLLPFAVTAVMANQRRAGIAAFIVAFVPLLPILWTMFPDRRTTVIRFAVVFALINAVYMPVAWNASGPWALPARSIRSNSDPNARDASSNYYRLAENINLKMTRDTSPWYGIGYGRPFAQYYALAMVTTDFVHYMPHNSILWVWMRLGHIGFFCFLMMLATVLIRGMHRLRETRDPMLRVVGILAVVDMLMLFTFGKYDLQFCNSKQMFVAAVMIGVLGILPKLDAQAEDKDQARTAETAA